MKKRLILYVMVSLLIIGGGNLIMANYLNENDSLASGYPKINAAIGQAEQSNVNSDNAIDTANSAVSVANQALSNSLSTQGQLNQIVIEGDSSVEAAQARVNADGSITYDTLKERLDRENQEVNSQLADKAYYYNRSRGQNYKKEIISIFDSVSEWSKYSGFGNTEEDISVFKHGNKSLKIETLTTDTSQTCMLDKSVSLDLTNKIVQLDLYIPDIANLTTVRISLITSNSSLSFITGRSPTTLKQGWNTISVSAKAFDKQGGATLSNLNDIKKIRITINSAAGTTTTVYLDRLLIYDNGLTKGRVTLAFDDGHSSVFLNAKPIMDRYGYVGVANVITSQHDGNTANRMTLEELKILNDMGWDIASHSHRHIDMTQLTEQEIYEDMSDSKTWLMKNGFFRGAEHFVTPLGYYNDTIINIAKKYFSSHRTNLSGVEAYPIADNYRLKVRNVSSSTAIETIQGWVDLCAESKDWLILLFHYIQEPVDASTVISPAMFRTIVDYIATKDVAVVTNSDMITNEIQSSKADNIENANENGRYIKFIDGTMICTCEMSWGETPITTVAGSLFRSEILQITFPESFAGIPSVGSPTFGGQNLVWWGGGYTTSLGINGYVISPTSVTPEALTGKAVAIGRWK